MHNRNLCMLGAGETGRVIAIDLVGGMRRRLMDLGVVEGTRIECIGHSPFGDPTAYLIRGAVIALRCEDAEAIKVS